MVPAMKIGLSSVWRWASLLSVGLIVGVDASAQQKADSSFKAEAVKPVFEAGKGPRVFIDAAHHNYHTANGRYKPFAELLRSAGCRLSSSTNAFSRKALEGCDILVIANALHESNTIKWELPTPSAFAESEIRAVQKWVKGGGSLLLIPDHMPFPGAAKDLGKAFGFKFGNGYARGPEGGVFSRENGLLMDHAVTRGRDGVKRIESVRTFTGQAFEGPKEARAILKFGAGHELLLTRRANRFPDDTPRVNIEGWLHAATLDYGKGRIAVFGEAAMFTAQVSSSGKAMGRNAPGAEQNGRLCLNVIAWLAGELE